MAITVKTHGLAITEHEFSIPLDHSGAAAIYVDDIYVERRFSEETAALVRGLRPWVTNEYEHNGLQTDGERVLGHLLELARSRA